MHIHGSTILACRVREVVEPVQAIDSSYDGRVPAPVPGERIKSGRRGVWRMTPRESQAKFKAVQALLASEGPGEHSQAQRGQIFNDRNLTDQRGLHLLQLDMLQCSDWMDISLCRPTYVHLFDVSGKSERLDIAYYG